MEPFATILGKTLKTMKEVHPHQNGVRLEIIAIAGMPASGKGEAMDFFVRKGFHCFSLGDAVREEAERSGTEPTAGNLAHIASSTRAELGDDIWAKRTADIIKRHEYDRIIIDGARSMSELEAIEKEFSVGIRVIAIHASPEIRFKRVISRARSDDSADRAVFTARDERELGYGLGEVIALSDFMVINGSSLESLKSRLEAVYKRLLESGE